MRQLKQQQSRKHKVVGGRWAVGGGRMRSESERGPAKLKTKNSAVASGQVYTPGWRLKAVGCITGDWWCYI
jgi:hypothetical protein